MQKARQIITFYGHLFDTLFFFITGTICKKCRLIDTRNEIGEAKGEMMDTYQLVGGESDDFNESIIGGLILSAIVGSAGPRMSSTSVARDVEEEDGMDFLFPQLSRDIFSVAFERHKLRQVFPFALQQVFASCLAVEHLVPQARIELLRPGLCYSTMETFNKVPSKRHTNRS